MLIILRNDFDQLDWNQIQGETTYLFFVTALFAADFDTFFSISGVFCHFLALFLYQPVTVIF